MNNAEQYRVRVSAAVLRPGDELLVVRESRLAIEVVNLPGGAPQLDETLEEAVAREVLEETGYEVIPSEIAFVAERRGDRWSQSVLEICFYAQLVPALRREPVPGDGVRAIEWLPLDHPDVRRHMRHVGLFRESKRGRYVDEASHTKPEGSSRGAGTAVIE